MRIIISPAKKMKREDDVFLPRQKPVFLKDTEEILQYLKSLDYHELKLIWKTSDKLTSLNYERIRNMDLEKSLSPAIFSYEGLQYQYLGAGALSYEELDYIEEHLRILSGFYGILRPFDGIVPYRLEMQAKFKDWDYESLYEFWGQRLAKEIGNESKLILDLASKEYSDSIAKDLDKGIRIVKCIFGEIIQGKVKEKATLIKMARGEMVRFMAEKKIKDLEELKSFDRLNYLYRDELSSDEELVFIKKDSLLI